jgi:ribosomal protein L37AE/L43A
MFKASERGEIALGGCVIDEASPTWRCRSCGHEWGGPPSTMAGLAAVTFGRTGARSEAAS